MKYFSITLGTSAEAIKKFAKENNVESCYGSWNDTLETLNRSICTSIENDFYLYIYKEEKNSEKILGCFSYDDSRFLHEEAYGYILSQLRGYGINKVVEEPHEITMTAYFDFFNEGERRGYTSRSKHTMDSNTYELYRNHNDGVFGRNEIYRYKYEERLVRIHNERECFIYDKKSKKELENIELHSNASDYQGNIAHYFIAARSNEAAFSITERLLETLLKAKRIKSRRMVVITEIGPESWRGNNYLEEIIETNKGGSIVFDLSERFGHSHTEYTQVCKYIEGLVKEYRKDILFVFTYNIDNPGFSYYLLPNLAQYIKPVSLREGTADRKGGIKYLESLIKDSEYKKYAYQAEEYLENYPGDKFTQTDIIRAYDRFEAWCLNKNIIKAYNFGKEEFMLDRDENAESAYGKLQSLIGLKTVKEQIDSIIAAHRVEAERKKCRGINFKSSSMHMIFGGDPGTGKSVVARCIAGIAKEKGVIKSGIFVETSGVKLTGLGCEFGIREAFEAAKGGVLFIDEAYALTSETATTTLLQEIENRRDEVIVILAGYSGRMKGFLEQNEGLKSRIPYWVDFPNYSAEELTEIFKLMLKERDFTATEEAVKEASYIFDKVRYTENFGNGRFVRNLFESSIKNQSVRLIKEKGNVENIGKNALFLLEKEDIFMPGENLKEARVPGTAMKELEAMVGLESAKAVIKKAVAGLKLRKLYRERGIKQPRPALHLTFTGSPGTAKTTVARLLAEILKDEKVLSSGQFIECGRADLVGDVVGSTAKIVKDKFRQAEGGVLFIDEAYSLVEDARNGFGDEAINTIVQEMENKREKLVVIFAGYDKPMEKFLERNPGMSSRIAFHVKFDDYTEDELLDIAKLMVSKNGMTITEKAMEKLGNICKKARTKEGYGNGRFIRKILEESQMNIAERLYGLTPDEITEEMLTVIEADDITESEEEETETRKLIGFCA